MEANFLKITGDGDIEKYIVHLAAGPGKKLEPADFEGAYIVKEKIGWSALEKNYDFARRIFEIEDSF